ncbi:MAG: hypothetical protein J6I74_02695 [Schwartzia sp.]|nr:hypothetical protein [Schwartzia sp. (in: firmicutes)]
MSRRQNKLAPKGIAAQAANFLLNLAVAVSWLFRRMTQFFTGKNRK